MTALQKRRDTVGYKPQGLLPSSSRSSVILPLAEDGLVAFLHGHGDVVRHTDDAGGHAVGYTDSTVKVADLDVEFRREHHHHTQWWPLFLLEVRLPATVVDHSGAGSDRRGSVHLQPSDNGAVRRYPVFRSYIHDVSYVDDVEHVALHHDPQVALVAVVEMDSHLVSSLHGDDRERDGSVHLNSVKLGRRAIRRLYRGRGGKVLGVCQLVAGEHGFS